MKISTAISTAKVAKDVFSSLFESKKQIARIVDSPHES
jgi:hypothetical protein